MLHALKPGLFAVLVLLAAVSVHAATEIPDGTVLPVRLNTTLSSKSAKPGQVVAARVMQAVPLPGGVKIHAGATLVGRVTGATPASHGTGGSLSVRFESLILPHARIQLSVRLRAIASFMEVQQAQDPLMGGDRGTPEGAWTTVQIGGEVVYRGGGQVEGKFGRVGEPVDGGVISSLNANPDGGCLGSNRDDRPQALWLFSSYACGAYGLPDLIIAHAGRTNPVGEMILRSEKGDVNVHSGGGLLLRVIMPANPGA